MRTTPFLLLSLALSLTLACSQDSLPTAGDTAAPQGTPVGDRHAAPPGYTATLLALPAGAVFAAAYSVNDSGIAVGRGFTSMANFFAVVWKSNGAAVVLASLPGQVGSTANDLTSGKTVVGTSFTNTGAAHPVLWIGNTVTRLADLGGSAGATGMNDNGVIAGYAIVGGKYHAVRWDNGVIQDIHPAGYSSSRGRDVNQLGDIVGYVSDGTDSTGYIWSHDGSQHLMGVLPGTTSSDSHGSNTAGMAVGVSTDGNDSTAFTWTLANGIQSAGFGGTRSLAYHANAKGRVVGWSYITGATSGPALTRLGAVLDTLPNSLGGFGRAYDVNACGMIVGMVQGATISTQRAIRWTKPSCD